MESESGQNAGKKAGKKASKKAGKQLVKPITDQHSNRWLLAISLTVMPALAAAQQNLLDLSLEELGQILVTSVSRQPQQLSETPSAIQVITRDDIRRSGASSIPEALRLASNLQVAQSSSQKWVITARGFSSDVGNKLLVMIDGRTIYTPLFSGVFWERQDYLLEDIDRIEVISGPGGTLWGTNAVNGVINIITRDAAQTHGLYADAGGGSQLRGFAGVRYGGTLAPNVNYRVYGKYSERDGSLLPNGGDVTDSWDMAQTGFRIDATPAGADSYTLQGDLYRDDAEVATGGEGGVNGVNVLGRWTHRFSDTSDMVLQLYYDKTALTLPTPAQVINNLPLAVAGVFKDRLQTYDVDLQVSTPLGESNRFVWGLAYRQMRDDVKNSPGLAFLPEQLDQELYSGFLQDEFTLIPKKLILTVGSKFEHNDYTGWETVPSARLQWNLAENHTLWSAVSRSVRIPSRIDRDISQPAPQQPPFMLVILAGGANFQSETVVAWEAGYRGQLNSRFITTVSAFHNEYDNIRSTGLSPKIFPLFFENNLEGETDGVEITASYQLYDWWRIGGGYNLLKEDLRVKDGAFDFNKALNETADPEHQLSLRSSMDLANNLTLDVNLRWVDDLVINDAGVVDNVPGYTEMNLRLGWTPSKNLELSLVGQNLLDNQHPEFGVTRPTRQEIGRSAYGKIAWRF